MLQKEPPNEELTRRLLDGIPSLPHGSFRFLLTLVDDSDAAVGVFLGAKSSASEAIHRLLDDSDVLDAKSTILRFLSLDVLGARDMGDEVNWRLLFDEDDVSSKLQCGYCLLLQIILSDSEHDGKNSSLISTSFDGTG